MEKKAETFFSTQKKTEISAFSGRQNRFVRWSPLVPPWKQRFDPPSPQQTRYSVP